MVGKQGLSTMGVFLLLVTLVRGAVECSTVAELISACSTFITYGAPDPIPGSPCCVAIMSLNKIAETWGNRHIVCGCLMGLVTANQPSAAAIATLPGFCGVSFGFSIDPATDCHLIP